MLDSSSSQSENSKQKKPKRRRFVPVMDPVLKVKNKNKGIVINLSMTKYQVISDVAEDLEWRIQYGFKKGDWDVLWTDQMIEPDTLIKMHFFQKISHFPGIHVLARKNLLGLSFMQMRKQFPQSYAFFPKTWLLPTDYPDFRQQVQKKGEQGQSQCYIVKPEADCQGKGIFLTFKTDNVENGKHYVVQEYVQYPFLVDGLKFDFRIYVLLCGTNPMRLYIYEQGLARFATEKYAPPNKANLKKSFMHLTNYAINKKNPKYVYNKSSKNMSTGHKRSMTSVFKNIQRRGFNLQALKNKIDDVIVKTVILGQPLVSHQYKFAQPDDEYRNMCFHILGIDIMIDELLNPIVLEVNHTPSFATDTPLDYFIKFNLIKDTLVLMNVNEQTKSQMIKKTNSYQRERITNAKKLVENQQKKQIIMQAQQQRDQYESKNCGRYTKIYPVDDPSKMQEYQQYFKHADKIYFSENNVIRSQIQQQKMKQKLNAKKASNKKLPLDSPAKSQPHPSSFSERQIEERSKIKNQSKESFHGQAKSSSLLGHPLNSLYPAFNSSSLTSPAHKRKTGYNTAKDYIKMAKSIGDMDSEQSPLCNRISLIRHLPKIQQPSPVKSSTIQTNKNKYIGLRKKKESQNKEIKIKPQYEQKKQAASGDIGSFLAPKVIKFEQFEDNIFASSLLKQMKDGSKQKQRWKITLGTGKGSSVGF